MPASAPSAAYLLLGERQQHAITTGAAQLANNGISGWATGGVGDMEAPTEDLAEAAGDVRMMEGKVARANMRVRVLRARAMRTGSGAPEVIGKVIGVVEKGGGRGEAKGARTDGLAEVGGLDLGTRDTLTNIKEGGQK